MQNANTMTKGKRTDGTRTLPKNVMEKGCERHCEINNDNEGPPVHCCSGHRDRK